MVNIAELLKKSIEKQKLKPTLEVRQHIYEKARSAIKSKLDEMDALELVQRSYMLQLEAAICEVEAFYVLEPEFFEIRDDSVTCHFAYHAYLPEYFGTRQDVAVDPSNLRSLTHEQNKLELLKKVDAEPEALALQAEIPTFNLQEGENKKSILPKEAYPVDIEIAAEPQHDDHISAWTGTQDLVGKQGDEGDESHIEPLIEGLEEEFNALSKDIANEALANANNNEPVLHDVDEPGKPSKPIDQGDMRAADQIHANKQLQIDDDKFASKSPTDTSLERVENIAAKSSESLYGKDAGWQQERAKQEPQDFQHDTLIASKLKDDNRQTTDRSETQQKQTEPAGNGSSSKPLFASRPNDIRHHLPNSRDQRMRVDNYPLYIDIPTYSSSTRGAFNNGQRIAGNRLTSDPISSGLKPHQSQEIRQETVFKRETIVMATSGSTPKPAKNEPQISERQPQYQQEVLQCQYEAQQTFGNQPKNDVMASKITVEKVVVPVSSEICGDLRSDPKEVDDLKQCSLSKKEQLIGVAGEPPLAHSDQEKEQKPQMEQPPLQSPKFNDDREQKKDNDENIKFHAETDVFSNAKPDADEITALIQKTSSAGKKISGEKSAPDSAQKAPTPKKETDSFGFFDQINEVKDNNVSEVSDNDRKEEGEQNKAAASSDAVEKFEKKRAEFFGGLNEVQPDPIKQDLFPKISLSNADNLNNIRKKNISGTRHRSLLANSWVTRSIAAGFIVLCVLSVGIYVFNRVEIPDVAISSKIEEKTDPSKTAAINHATSSNEGEPLLPKSDATDNSAKNNKSDVNVKDEETYQNTMQKERRLPFDNTAGEIASSTPQSDLSEKPVDQNIKDASLSSTVEQPSIEQSIQAKEAMIDSKGEQKEQDKASDAEQLETTLKQEPGLLLLTDKKNKQTKMQGIVSWSLLRPHAPENPLNETALVAQFRTNDGKLGVRMSIRKNYRQNLGATHLIDLTFSQSNNFDGGVVVDVKGIYYGNKVNVLNKQTATIVANLYENNFVASLRNDTENKEVNRDFIERSTVMGVDTVFTDGKTALFILNKGQAEAKLFETFNAKNTH